MSRGKEKQKIIIGMRKGSDFLKKSGIISNNNRISFRKLQI